MNQNFKEKPYTQTKKDAQFAGIKTKRNKYKIYAKLTKIITFEINERALSRQK
jgi:hypothetical protein